MNDLGPYVYIYIQHYLFCIAVITYARLLLLSGWGGVGQILQVRVRPLAEGPGGMGRPWGLGRGWDIRSLSSYLYVCIYTYHPIYKQILREFV